MSDQDFNTIIGLITITAVLCCCCLVVIGGGVGAFFFFRNRQKSADDGAATVPVMTNTMSATPPSPFVSSEPFAADPAPSFITEPVTLPEEPPALDNFPGPATPIDADDIRARVLALNAPEKSYVVQATGYKLVVAPTAITGYLLEVAFDYVERVARFVETNAYAADASLKSDVRGVLEANGWTIRESSTG